MTLRASRRHAAGAEVVGLIAGVLLAAPALVGIAYAAAASLGVVGPGAGGASVERIARVFTDRATWRGLVLTLWVAALATALAMAGAVLVAVMFRGAGWRDRAARALALLPLPVPHLVAGMLGLWVLGQSGEIARLLAAFGAIRTPAAMPPLVYDRWAVGLAFTMAWKEFAFLAVVATTLLASPALEVEEAARTLGAMPLQTFVRITWPILWRGLMPAVIAVFVFVAGSYEAAVLLAPSDPLALPLLVADRAADPDLARRGDAYVVSLLLLAIAVVVVVAHEWTRARWEQLDS
ncbi:MAG: ABC transporter permease subunit [Gemmatimonadaceae bacterium]|nr:ABC transporter permease subunit [Gemmatimonadaceae bacterium]